MLDYIFINHTAELTGKTIKSYQEFNFNGIIHVVIATEDNYVLAKRYENGAQYGSEYVHEEYFYNMDELFKYVDHELIGTLITEEEYELLTEQEEEKERQESEKHDLEMKQRRYEEFLKLKVEFENDEKEK